MHAYMTNIQSKCETGCTKDSIESPCMSLVSNDYTCFDYDSECSQGLYDCNQQTKRM